MVLYQTVAADNSDNTPKTVQRTFKSLKDLSLSMHKLAMVVAMDYIKSDTWTATLPLIGHNAKVRRGSLNLSTGTFERDSNYHIAHYETDFKNGSIEKETYSRKEKQLQLFEPHVSM
ncbi:MAG: hypothetical protein AABX31_00490, partial [Nanoarchaeota archaeon]